MAKDEYELDELDLEQELDDEDYSDDDDDGEDDGVQKPAGLIKGALKPYNPAQYSTHFLNQLIQLGDIDLNVEYQRDVVWPETKQIGLIDSLFHNYYIPPVLFAVRTEDDGSTKRVCIDGKQRLTSIMLFMNGSIPWKPASGKGKKYWYIYSKKDNPGATNNPLPDRERRLFDLKMVQCAEFHGIPESHERDIFQRVQLGMALAPAEKLRAIASPYAQYMSSLLKKWIYSDNGYDQYYGAWDKARGRDFQNVAMMVKMIQGLPDQQHSSFGATSMSPFLKNTANVERTLRQEVDEVFADYLDILANYLSVSFNAVPNKLSPIEFAFTGVVIYVLRKHYSNREIAEWIGKMRVHIRTKHKDIRANGLVTKELWAWLDSVPKRSKRAREDIEDDDEYVQEQKRYKRVQDGDYRGPAIALGSTASRPNVRADGQRQ